MANQFFYPSDESYRRQCEHNRRVHKINDAPSSAHLKTGDKVFLKSGGPTMTIYTVRKDGIVDTVWFAGTELRNGAFLPEMLRGINPIEVNPCPAKES